VKLVSNNEGPRTGAGIERAGAFIFDLDGTLFDTKNIAVRVSFSRLSDVFTIRGERITRKELRGRDFGSPEAYYWQFFDSLSKKTGRPAASLRSWYFRRYMPLLIKVLKKHYNARPGTVDLFMMLNSSSVPFAIYSDYPCSAERLAAIGIDPDLCGKIYGPDDFGAQKPAPRPFLKIAGDLGVLPGEVCVVGDRNDTDGDGAAAAGMDFVRIINQRPVAAIVGNAGSADGSEGRYILTWEEFTARVRGSLLVQAS
jgi:FMN phosphatase YigB (HAD superfamily)